MKAFLRRYRLQHAEAAKVTGFSLDTIRSVLYGKRAMPEPMHALIEACDAMTAEQAHAYVLARLRSRSRNISPE